MEKETKQINLTYSIKSFEKLKKQRDKSNSKTWEDFVFKTICGK